MDAALRIPPVMTMQEFLAWNAPSGPPWQLIDGEPVAMAPTSRTHGIIQGELARLIGNHLLARGSACAVISNPGVVPRVRSDSNYRIPDLGVTCSPYREEEYGVTNPVLLIEILSPSNQAETWTNIWAYTTIPSVQEILIVHSIALRVDRLARAPEGHWPERAEVIEEGLVTLAGIDFQVDITALYRGTGLLAG